MDKNRKKSIEQSTKEIFHKAEVRERVGRDPFNAGWQATLEIMILMMEKNILEQPGQLLAMQIEDQKEWEFYLDIKEKLDLPPETCAVLVTPSAFKNIPILEDEGVEYSGPTPWERDAYSLVISDLEDHETIMQAALPGIENAGIDVFDDGNHLADYSYNTIEECVDELTKITWIHFNPEGKWTDELIIRYTENWYAKCLEMDLESSMVHGEFSYLHHPELVNLTPLESVFRAIGEVVPKEYENIQEMIKTTNDMNRDFGFDKPDITKEGILQDKISECRALLDRIEMDMDMALDGLQHYKGVKFSQNDRKAPEYRQFFDATEMKIYEVMIGRPYPK